MTRGEVLALFDKITVWSQQGIRAPHKPLLVLSALARLVNGESRLQSYESLAEPMQRLLAEFGPSRSSYHPEYPFWRLQNDAVWEVEADRELTSRRRADHSPRTLIAAGARGGFPPDVHAAFVADRTLVAEVALRLLDAHFEESMFDSILETVGLDLGLIGRARSRDPRFRVDVIRAYESRCAVCDGGLRLGDRLVAMEAAHIKWHNAGGPDVVANGLALCALHHRLFDAGAYTVDPDGLRIEASESAVETWGGGSWLLDRHGKSIRSPQDPKYRPDPEYLAWHRSEVFRGPGRSFLLAADHV